VCAEVRREAHCTASKEPLCLSPKSYSLRPVMLVVLATVGRPEMIVARLPAVGLSASLRRAPSSANLRRLHLGGTRRPGARRRFAPVVLLLAIIPQLDTATVPHLWGCRRLRLGGTTVPVLDAAAVPLLTTALAAGPTISTASRRLTSKK
jgi:hypothetical protein